MDKFQALDLRRAVRGDGQDGILGLGYHHCKFTVLIWGRLHPDDAVPFRRYYPHGMERWGHSQ